MNQFLLPSLVNSVGVSDGLYILWSVLKFAAPGQWPANTAIADMGAALLRASFPLPSPGLHDLVVNVSRQGSL